MPNAPKVRIVTLVPYDNIIASCRQEILDAAYVIAGIPPPSGEIGIDIKLAKGKNGVKVVVSIA